MSKTSPANEADASSSPYFGVFDLFKIGVGPSSSHSVGPMRAAEAFLAELQCEGKLDAVRRVQVDLYGSLALTGRGHGTDVAVLMGLLGEKPDEIDPDLIAAKASKIRADGELQLAGRKPIKFHEENDLIFNKSVFLDAHPNGIRFQALETREAKTPLLSAVYLSVGGGFVIREGQETKGNSPGPSVPFPFSSAKQLLELTASRDCSISSIAIENEKTFRAEDDLRRDLQRIWTTMQECVRRGCREEGVLPGGLNVQRRAPGLFKALNDRTDSTARDPMSVLDWVNLYALAVSEENAAGGRVVTAPTNGAAGIIPAVLHYFNRFCPEASQEKIERF
ncbi:MAG: L-serine ammonia-lyase, partial [Planctomycetales bacterium]